MGCFSYMCKKSGKAILSDSFSGDAVHLFLLYKGEVIEYMYGNYDSYGRVFSNSNGSFEWKMDWSDIIDLSYENDNTSGIAAILDSHFNGEFPTERSNFDPNQGWGDDSVIKKVENPFHKVFKEIKKEEIKKEEIKTKIDYKKLINLISYAEDILNKI